MAGTIEGWESPAEGRVEKREGEEIPEADDASAGAPGTPTDSGGPDDPICARLGIATAAVRAISSAPCHRLFAA